MTVPMNLPEGVSQPTPEQMAIRIEQTPEEYATMLLSQMKQVQGSPMAERMPSDELAFMNQHIATLEAWLANPITAPPWTLSQP